MACEWSVSSFPIWPNVAKPGNGRPPDREPVLRETWHRVIESVEAKTSVHRRQIDGRPDREPDRG